MSESYDYGRISPTAKFVAHVRRFTDIPYAAEVAVAARVDEAVAQLLRGSELTAAQLRHVAPVVEIRYKSLVAAIRRAGVQQVLELASGLALRGLALTADPELLYLETDLPGISEEKRRIVEDLVQRGVVPERRNLRILDVDVFDRPQLEAAVAHLTPGLPVAVVHEGLFPYFDLAEKERAALNVRSILERFGGVWATPDLDFKAGGDRWSGLGGDAAQRLVGAMHAALSAQTARSLEQNAFQSEQHVHDFFGKLGFVARVVPQWDESFAVSSIAELKLPEAALAVFRALKLWELRLATP